MANRIPLPEAIGTVTFDWHDGPAHHVVTVKLSASSINQLILKAHDSHRVDVEDRLQPNKSIVSSMAGAEAWGQ